MQDPFSDDTPFHKRESEHRRAVWEWATSARIGRCEVCGYAEVRKLLDPHHLTYRHVPHEPPEVIRTLCKVCHVVTHALVELNARLVLGLPWRARLPRLEKQLVLFHGGRRHRFCDDGGHELRADRYGAAWAFFYLPSAGLVVWWRKYRREYQRLHGATAWAAVEAWHLRERENIASAMGQLPTIEVERACRAA